MGFSKPRPAIEDKRIKRRATGIVGNSHCRRTGKLVAVSLDKVLKGVPRVQIALHKGKFTQPKGGTHSLTRMGLCCRGGGFGRLVGLKRKFQLAVSRGGVIISSNGIIQRCLFAQDPRDGLTNQRVIMLFYPVIKELAGDLDRQLTIFKLEWNNGLEPGLKTQT